MFGWLKLWEVVWQEAKWCKVWYLAGNLKVSVRFASAAVVLSTKISSLSGDIKKVTKAKVAVFTNPIDTAQTETKGTVLIKNADEMLNFTRGEEKHMEKVSIYVMSTLEPHSLNPTRRYSKSSPTRV